MKPIGEKEDRMRFVEDALIILAPVLLTIAGLGSLWFFWGEWIH